jgi:hypothetical protein
VDRKKLRFTRSSIEPVCVRPRSRNPCLANGCESLARTLAAFGALAAIHFGLRRLARFESGADLTRGPVTCFPDGRVRPIVEQPQRGLWATKRSKPQCDRCAKTGRSLVA